MDITSPLPQGWNATGTAEVIRLIFARVGMGVIRRAGVARTLSGSRGEPDKARPTRRNDRRPRHIRQGYGGPPKPSAKAEGFRLRLSVIRAVIVWCGLLVLAVVNGGIREAVIIPRTGDLAGHAISTILLCILILTLAWLTIGWMHPASSAEAWRIGGLWMVLVLAFEFLAGHYLFGTPWSELLADYNVLRGRIWPLVPATTAMAPYVAGRLRGSWSSSKGRTSAR
jgi:hypothetical protein